MGGTMYEAFGGSEPSFKSAREVVSTDGLKKVHFCCGADGTGAIQMLNRTLSLHLASRPVGHREPK